MIKYYDKLNNRMVFINLQASAGFWDLHWENYDIKDIYQSHSSAFDYVIRTTKKYLPKGSLILEGGCGLGQQVYKLQNHGYLATGIDYAEKTVEMVRKAKPELDIRLGDVTRLEFGDNYFDGYWSFGVIEHFYNGFETILQEMKRVIKPGGFLFLTFPHMNWLRKTKARRNKYPSWQDDEQQIKNFYQFALDSEKIKAEFEKNGFIYVNKQHLDGLKGLKDEIVFLKKTLQKIYDSKNLFGMALAKMISMVFSRFSSHSIFLIFIKR
jgi:SAM-dependent methyltransferase